MSFVDQPAAREGRISNINDLYLSDEAALIRELTDAADPGDAGRQKIQDTAARLVRSVRKNTSTDSGIEAFLQQYDLSSEYLAHDVVGKLSWTPFWSESEKHQGRSGNQVTS